ncbi:MAG: DUF2182 domain-containing protein [Chloroflexi bacterium]|nr:DUF2182 domain-containing protein [Chloroflexota bacterium]
MVAASTPELRRERFVILAALLVMSAVTWSVVVWQSRTMDTSSMDRMLTMDMSTVLFMGMWVLMMVAMMFPTAAPMVLTFAKVSRTRESQGRGFVPTWVFVASYLVIWTLFGVASYFIATGLEDLANNYQFLMDHGARIGGGVLMLAGLYQLSPLKNACLSTCRTPLGWVITSWREGYTGAFQMGLAHGTYCVGCCWLLFVILFPLGIMNVAAMGGVTLLVFSEKALPHGPRIARIAGVALLAYGLTVVIYPDALPSMISASGNGSMEMGS